MQLSAEVELVRIPPVGAGGDTELCLLDWGGDGPEVLLAHGTGFCAALFEPIARRLRARFRVRGFDQRGHGRSAGADLANLGWGVFRDDLVALLGVLRERQAADDPTFVIGHSLGGTSALCAAAARPDLFGRLMLLDPVTIALETIRARERGGEKSDLSSQARKRRATWPSREEAHARWRARGPLARWDADVLELYVNEGFRDRPDGQVELACDPAVEARVFEMTDYPDLRAAAARVRTETLWLYASAGNFDADAVRSTAGASDAIALEEIDAGHLFPMEQPAETARRALRFGARQAAPD